MRRVRLSRVAARIRAELLKRPGWSVKPRDTQRCPACGRLVYNAEFDFAEGECRGCVREERVAPDWPTDLNDPFLPEE